DRVNERILDNPINKTTVPLMLYNFFRTKNNSRPFPPFEQLVEFRNVRNQRIKFSRLTIAHLILNRNSRMRKNFYALTNRFPKLIQIATLRNVLTEIVI